MKIKLGIKYGLNKRSKIYFIFEVYRNRISKQAEKKQNKIFCIGFGKTGTTSLEHALRNFGYRMGNQPVAEILAEDWASKRVDRIIRYCYTADAFQDSPFSKPGLYKELDKAFPHSKFILTIRDNPDQWYNSLINFHSKLFSKNGDVPPTEHDLENAMYRYKGFMLDSKKLFSKYPNVPLYDEQFYKKEYVEHIKDVKAYFKGREDDLLVLNVSEPKSYQKLANFLEEKVSKKDKFPWKNKT